MLSLKVWVSSADFVDPAEETPKKGRKKKKDKLNDSHVERIIPFDDLGITLKDWEDDSDKYQKAVSSISGIRQEWGVSLITG